jgi:hypothetical protein
MDLPSSVPTIRPSYSESEDSGQNTTLRNEAITIATFSIILYGIVFLIASYYYLKFLRLERKHLTTVYHPSSGTGKYDQAKKLFFGILALSALLDIPTYIGCLANNGPTDCEWDGPEELLFWYFHLCALCGYACCIIIPCVLWSDMINKRDGKLFFSAYPYDRIKRYFQCLLVLYFLNVVINIIGCSIYYKLSDPTYFQQSPTASFYSLLECILIVLISTGCLYCGLRLQIYVHEAKLNPIAEMKFLFTLNVILFMIVISFLGRAILVVKFARGMPKSFQHPVNYAVFILIARWTPDVFCQILLCYIMRLSSGEIAAKHNPTSAVVIKGGTGRGSQLSGHYSGYFSRSQKFSMKDRLISGEYSPDSSELAALEESLLPVFKMGETYKNTAGNKFISTNEYLQEDASTTAHTTNESENIRSQPIPIDINRRRKSKTRQMSGVQSLLSGSLFSVLDSQHDSNSSVNSYTYHDMTLDSLENEEDDVDSSYENEHENDGL